MSENNVKSMEIFIGEHRVKNGALLRRFGSVVAAVNAISVNNRLWLLIFSPLILSDFLCSLMKTSVINNEYFPLKKFPVPMAEFVRKFRADARARISLRIQSFSLIFL